MNETTEMTYKEFLDCYAIHIHTLEALIACGVLSCEEALTLSHITDPIKYKEKLVEYIQAHI